MQQTGQILPAINGLLKPYLIILWIIIPALSGVYTLHSQAPDPKQSIRDLKQGILLVRMPASKAKIDTLKAMIARSDKGSKDRLQKMLDETIQDRDSTLAQYTRAFRDAYHFSESGYYFDYEGHDHQSAHYYKMNGDPISAEELSRKPVCKTALRRNLLRR